MKANHNDVLCFCSFLRTAYLCTMRFNPIKQFNTILQHEYLEPTITWSFRVVLALNVPLLVFPLIFGFSYHIVFSAFAAYMLTLIDYRGTHYRKMLIQSVEGGLIVIVAVLGMNVGNSIALSVACMFIIGIFAALIRNWSDYGSTIGVGVGFFFLFGISNPTNFWNSLVYAQYIVYGCLWAIAIIFLSFPFSASNPMRRSVATIWKKNTAFLDELLAAFLEPTGVVVDWKQVLAKEADIRSAVDKSIELFNRRKESSRFKAEHYDQMIEIRKTAAFFGANAKLLLDEISQLHERQLLAQTNAVLYKTMSALSQASARLSILIFTNRGEDFTMATVRVKRYMIAVNLLKKSLANQSRNQEDAIVYQQLFNSLEQAYTYLQQAIDLIDEKNKFQRSNYVENYKLSFNHFIAGLQPRVLLQIIREIFNVDSQQFKYALRVAVGLAFSVFIFKYFQIDHGHWIALTLLIVIQPYYGATRKKAVERIVGTIAGIVVGGGIMLLPLTHEAFVFILIFISFFVAYFLRNNYKVGVFFVTIMLVVLMQLSQQGSWDLIWWRVLSTAIGAVLAILISFAFWPIWEQQRFPKLLERSLELNRFFLQQVVLSYGGQLPQGITWHKSRRVAEAANNNLFACVQRMYEEPLSHQREIDAHFAKVGANIRISREITSLAFALEKTTFDQEIYDTLHGLTHRFNAVFQALIERKEHIAFESLMDGLSGSGSLNKPENRALLTDLEKIIFELTALKAFRGV